jgi:SNF2 family DNA or RNA helicase
MLPKKRRQSFYVSPSDQCAPSAGFAAELREARKQGASHVFETKLAQAASGKRKAVLGIIEDHVGSAQKVVVFTARKRDCDLLGKDVASNALVKSTKAQVWVAHGAQTTATRQAIIDEYMAHPGPCVLVGTGHAFGESLNIHDTDAALFVMLPFTPGQLRQWEGRFTRLGQKRPVVIYYVIAEGTVDEHVASILIDKLPAVEDIADDTELAAAKNILAGIDENESEEAFMQSILADLDFDEDGD